jgi:hypothetical protein
VCAALLGKVCSKRRRFSHEAVNRSHTAAQKVLGFPHHLKVDVPEFSSHSQQVFSLSGRTQGDSKMLPVQCGCAERVALYDVGRN